MNAAVQAKLTAASQEAETARSGESFTGPDTKTYIGTFAAPDAFQIAAAGLQMGTNGFADRTIISLTCTRSQFAAPPLTWRRGKLVRTAISPSQTLTIHSVTTDDPLYFGFILTNYQPTA